METATLLEDLAAEVDLAAQPSRGPKISKTYSASLYGIAGAIIEIETDLSNGLPGFSVVGLGDKAVTEARERVRAAVKNSGLSFPQRKIVTNLAPADLKKEGSAYDLAIAASILTAAGIIPALDRQTILLGELGLDGGLRGVVGVVPMLIAAKRVGFTTAFVPTENLEEARVISGIKLYGVSELRDLVGHLLAERPLRLEINTVPAVAPNLDLADFADIRGQQRAKRALEIAAVGGHNVLFSGPPGTGKTLLARAYPGILPDLSAEEQLELTMIYSAAGLTTRQRPLITTRPFRSPHHTASNVALIGGGAMPRPGEVTLAHRGVLFLDELPEFPKSVLESLRQPLEDKVVSVARVAASMTFPAHFMLLAAQNPCPCGYYGDTKRVCECAPLVRSSYQRKLSGPLRDRFDLYVEFPRLEYEELTGEGMTETSAIIKARVIAAKAELERNFSDVTSATFKTILDRYLTAEAKDLFAKAVKTLNISTRQHRKLLRIACSIAALASAATVSGPHLAEALSYRIKEA